MDVKLRILRFNPETDRKGHWEEYNIEADPDERILDLLHKVKWFDDGSLAFRRSCAHGVCGSDARELAASKQFNPNSIDQTWAPTVSNISVLLTPVYSRESIKNFSLADFARGELNGKGADQIGFI